MKGGLYWYLPFLVLMVALGSCTESTNSATRLQNGQYMRELQTLLQGLGFGTGGSDGIYGTRTAGAIRAYQKSRQVKVDGKPTRGLLERLRNDDQSGTWSKTASRSLDPCLNNRSLGAVDRVVQRLYGVAMDSLPVSLDPYLTGLCTPQDRRALKRLYLYLVAQGALHSRLTLVKYDELVSVATRAGVDLGVREDAFRRSVETLDEDVIKMSAGGTSGLGPLMAHYEPEEAESARILLENLPQGYRQLQGDYRRQVRVLMAEALSHSVSATFYLGRGGYTVKRLTDFIDVENLDRDEIARQWAKILGDVRSALDLIYFIWDSREALSSMLLASTYSIKTLTQDIEDIPRIDQTETERELDRLREKNGLTLDEFEQQFQREQREQLAKV
jgi:hypothetical protein